MFKYALLTVCIALTACTATYTQPRPEDLTDSYASERAISGEDSLFSSDAAVLSDADIARVLDYKYVPPARSRIAILPFGWNTWSGWSEQMAIATEAVNAELISRLRSSSRVYDASFLPSIVVPEKKTVPYLREAAARYQADLLLIFRSSCRSFDRYRLLRANQTRAFCGVEAVLLDVRTGLVPFVASATQTFEASENSTDINFRETVLKSQLDATSIALGEVSKATVQFLERVSAEPGN
jgi:hypothetical protein